MAGAESRLLRKDCHTCDKHYIRKQISLYLNQHYFRLFHVRKFSFVPRLFESMTKKSIGKGRKEEGEERTEE